MQIVTYFANPIFWRKKKEFVEVAQGVSSVLQKDF